MTLEVGDSLWNPKTVTIADGYICPLFVDSYNWLDGHTFDDTFSIEQNNSQVLVTRTDTNKNWYFTLRFECCRRSGKLSLCGKITKRYIYFFKL